MSEHQATVIGLDYITVDTVPAQITSDEEVELTIKIVDGDDSKSPGSQVDVAYDNTVVNITATDVNGDPLFVKQGGFVNSQATVQDGIVVLSDFSVEIPGGSAVSPIVIKVETDLTEDAIKTTTGRNYKPVGQVSRVVTDVTTGFFVTAPASITRGVAFNITIQAFTLVDGQLDTSFVPGPPDDKVNISLSAPTDPSDVISPSFTDNTGWQVVGQEGSKTVSVTISGGSGTDTESIQADDPAGGATGSTDLVVNDPTITLINFVEAQVYDSGLQSISGTPDLANWIQVQVDAQAAFDIDNTLSLVATNTWLRSVQRVNTSSVRAQVQSGFMKFTLGAGDKVGVVAAKVRFRLSSTENDDFSAGPFRHSPNANLRQFKIKSSENATLFPSGSALRAMVPDKTYEFSEINQKNRDAGDNPPTTRFPAVDIELDIKASVITGMTGLDLFVWFYIHSTAIVPFAPPFTPVDSDTPESMEVTDFLALGSTIKLVLFK